MQVLSSASGLNPGNKLWILPEFELSKWALKLDWYLNFQLNAVSHHRHARRSSNLENLLAEIDWSLPNFKSDEESPLMISCEGHLPARWLVVVPGSRDANRWVSNILKSWQGLGEPSFKVFLPNSLHSDEFVEAWKKVSKFDDFSLVLDQDPR